MWGTFSSWFIHVKYYSDILFVCQAKRHKQRAKASHKSASAAEKKMKKFLMSKILEQVSGERSKVSNLVPPTTQEEGDDMFKLPPLPKEPEGILSNEGGVVE